MIFDEKNSRLNIKINHFDENLKTNNEAQKQNSPRKFNRKDAPHFSAIELEIINSKNINQENNKNNFNDKSLFYQNIPEDAYNQASKSIRSQDKLLNETSNYLIKDEFLNEGFNNHKNINHKKGEKEANNKIHVNFDVDLDLDNIRNLNNYKKSNNQNAKDSLAVEKENLIGKDFTKSHDSSNKFNDLKLINTNIYKNKQSEVVSQAKTISIKSSEDKNIKKPQKKIRSNWDDEYK